MGLSWSTRHDFYMHEFQNTRVQRLQKEMIIDVHKHNNTNIFAGLVNEELIDQKVVLYSFSVKTINNSYDSDVHVFVDNMFPNQKKPMQINCPANSSFNLKDMDTIFYRHILNQDKVQMYAGLDKTILEDKNGQLSETTDFECFPLNHPIVEFTLKHGKLLEPDDGDVVKKEGEKNTYYLIKSAFLEKVRTFFKQQVFDRMEYTRFENAKLYCNIPETEEGQKTLLIIVEFEYFLINPGNGSLFHTEERLN